MKTRSVLLILITFFSFSQLHAQQFVRIKNEMGNFPVVSAAGIATICTDEKDHALVSKAASLLQNDIQRVTGQKPATSTGLPASAKNIIIIGTIEQSSYISRLAASKK